MLLSIGRGSASDDHESECSDEKEYGKNAEPDVDGHVGCEQEHHHGGATLIQFGQREDLHTAVGDSDLADDGTSHCNTEIRESDEKTDDEDEKATWSQEERRRVGRTESGKIWNRENRQNDDDRIGEEVGGSDNVEPIVTGSFEQGTKENSANSFSQSHRNRVDSDDVDISSECICERESRWIDSHQK